MQSNEQPVSSAFGFVEALARDLSGDDLELPGFPDVVMDLHRALGNEHSSAGDIVALINSEPALAARLVRMANSAAFNASGKPVSEPRAAITALGFNVVRATATSFAMAQMEQIAWLKPIRADLREIWRASNTVAAICGAVARRIEGIKAEEAVAAGLFHLLGRLYILARAHRAGIEIAQQADWHSTMESWHPIIAKAILDCWGMPGHITEATEKQNADVDEDLNSEPVLVRLLVAARRYDALMQAHDGGPRDKKEEIDRLERDVEAVRLDGRPFLELATECADDIVEIRRSFC